MASRVVHLGPTWSVRTVDRVKKLVPDPEPCNYDDFAQLRADGFDGPNCDCRGRCGRLGVADLSHRPPTARTRHRMEAPPLCAAQPSWRPRRRRRASAPLGSQRPA